MANDRRQCHLHGNQRQSARLHRQAAGAHQKADLLFDQLFDASAKAGLFL
jgi:hypothetical protein